MPAVLRPFVAYLRVYEPLSAFDSPFADQLRTVGERAQLRRAVAGQREREVWLRSLISRPAWSLPGELPDGRPAPNNARDVLMIDAADVPTDGTTAAGPGPLFCPLDVLPRSAAALVGFLSTAHPVLRDAAFAGAADGARARATDLLAEPSRGVVHVVSTTWTVPLPWFVIVDPTRRHIVVATQEDPRRQVSWLATMGDARSRVARAHELAVGTFGADQGPAKVLSDTGEWLRNFHPNSAVELDYGGLVQLLDDTALLEDTSAEDVHAILDSIESGDAGQVAKRFERLREFWSDLAIRERLS